MRRRRSAMWPSVRRGEEKNIFPYQEEADVMFNSALIYELAVLKPYVEALLFGVDRESTGICRSKTIVEIPGLFCGNRK